MCICICNPYPLSYSDVAQQFRGWPLTLWEQHSGLKMKILKKLGVLVKQVEFSGQQVLRTVYDAFPLICVIYFNDKCIFNGGYSYVFIKKRDSSSPQLDLCGLSTGAASQGPRRYLPGIWWVQSLFTFFKQEDTGTAWNPWPLLQSLGVVLWIFQKSSLR